LIQALSSLGSRTVSGGPNDGKTVQAFEFSATRYVDLDGIKYNIADDTFSDVATPLTGTIPFANLNASDVNTNLTFVGFIDTDGDGIFNAANGDEVIPQLFSEEGTIRFTPTVSGELFIVFVDQDYSDNQGDLSFGVNFTVERDTDADGIFDHLDIDSDNDGITDNTEAQATDNTIAPSGVGTGITDINADGLDDVYDNTTAAGSASGAAGKGLLPVDSDGNSTEALPDYIDLDSDDDGLSDADEAGHGQGQQTGVSDLTTDADGDGLFDSVDEVDGTSVGWDSNDEDVTTADGQRVADKSEFNLIDTHELADDLSNVNINDSNIDLAFRDTKLDTDSDGINDDIDVDDDNDGIMDFDEGLVAFNLVPNSAPVQNGVLGNGRIWTYNNVATVDGNTYNLQVEQIAARSAASNSFALSNSGGVNIISWNAKLAPYLILEYSLIDQATGDTINIEAFRFQQNDIDGQRFGATNNLRQQTEAWEIIGFETGEPESITFNSNNLSAGPGNSNFIVGGSRPAGYTTIRQPGIPGNATTASNNVAVEYRDVPSFRVMYGVTTDNQSTFANVGNISRNFFFGSFEGIFFDDSGEDGILDKNDIDSDNDGITDNVEAQSTANYIAPSGQVADGTFVDANKDGLDDNYDSTQSSVTGTNAGGTFTHTGTGLIPVNTDGLNEAYLMYLRTAMPQTALM